MDSSASTTDTLDEAPVEVGPRVLIFRIGERVYGCELGPIREIVAYRRPTRLPGAPAHVQGLVNVRGTIATVIDLGQRIDPARPPVREGSIVLVSHGPDGARLAGIAVEQVLDVQHLAVEQLREATDASDGAVRGLGHLGEQVVLVVDVHTLLAQTLVTA